MEYLATGCTRLNDMIYPDDSKVEGFLGGTLYTVTGIKPFTDSVLLITTAGPDFDHYYGDYFQRNKLSKVGVQFVLPQTEYTILEYDADGRWWEYSKYGEDFDKEWGLTALIKADFVTKYADQETLGIYFESGVRESIWQGLAEIRSAAPNAKIMWEIPTGDTDDQAIADQVFDLINKCDLYSINLPESLTLFGTSSETESIQRIIEIGLPCFFRVGEKGAYMITDGKAWFAPAVQPDKSVDATGCGNCSTGTAMYGFCENLHPLKTVILANLAAQLNAMQYGPFPHFTEELRTTLFDAAEEQFLQQIKE